MLRYLKYVAIAVLAIIALTLTAGIIVSLTFDPNEYKDRIAQLVEERTGRQLIIGDDLELTVFPWLGVTTGNVSMSNAAGFGDDPFLELGRISAHMKLLPLVLDREFEISTITLDGLKLNLARNKAGVTNWDDLRQPTDAEDEANETEEDEFSLRDLEIEGLKITDSQIRWHENTTEVRYILQELNLATGGIGGDEPVALNASFKALSVEPQFAIIGDVSGTATILGEENRSEIEGLKLDFTVEDGQHEQRARGSLSGNITADMNRSEITVESGSLAVNLVRPPVGPESADISATLDTVVINLDKQSLTSSSLNVEALGTHTVLELSGSRIVDNPKLTGGIRVEVSSASQLAEVIKEFLPETVTEDDIADFALNGNVEIDTGAGTITLGRVDARALGLSLSGDITVQNFDAQPTFSGDVAISEFVPRELIQKMLGESVPTADEAVLLQASGRARLSGSASAMRLDNIQMVLDQTKVNGWFGVKNFENPIYEFDLAMDGIDLDRYLAPIDAQPDKADDSADDEDIVIPADQIRGLNMNGRARVNKLKMSGIQIQNAGITVLAADGIARFAPMTASMYGGGFDGQITINALGSKPALAIQGALRGIRLDSLEQALFGQARIRGTANLAIDLSGEGETFDENLGSSVGSVNFRISNGEYHGFNLGYTLCNLHNQFAKIAPPDRNVPNVTRFEEFTGTAAVQQGVATTDDLRALLAFGRITGRGISSLPDQRLNYDIDATLTSAVPITGCEAMEKLVGESIPIKISGSFDNPSIQPDFGRLITRQLQRAIESEVTKKIFDIFGPKKPKEDPNKDDGGG